MSMQMKRVTAWSGGVREHEFDVEVCSNLAFGTA